MIFKSHVSYYLSIGNFDYNACSKCDMIAKNGYDIYAEPRHFENMVHCG